MVSDDLSSLLQVVDCYVQQCSSANPENMESACACIAELAAKLDQDAIEPHVPRLLHAVLGSFIQAVPQLQGSCTACGRGGSLSRPIARAAEVRGAHSVLTPQCQKC